MGGTLIPGGVFPPSASKLCLGLFHFAPPGLLKNRICIERTGIYNCAVLANSIFLSSAFLLSPLYSLAAICGVGATALKIKGKVTTSRIDN